MNKFNAKKTEVDGILFDSRKEAFRYVELKHLEKTGEIKNLELQKTYELIPKRRRISDGVLERGCVYKADFVYEKDGVTIVEDVKGCKFGAAYAVFKLKRKMMLDKYGIEIVET